MSTRDHVVVGTDGSEAATRAVVIAAREAAVRNVPLRVVHGFVWPALHAPLGASVASVRDPRLREAAEELLRHAKATAEAAEPGLRCETELVPDLAAAALLRASRDAEVVLVGDRGLGGFASLLVGSTAVQLSMYASCPVIVVRQEPPEGAQQVVVGVDASEHAPTTLGFAFEEAALRGVPLHALHAHRAAAGDDPERLVAGLLAEFTGKYPDLPVSSEVVTTPPPKALVEASAGAALVVVGSRGVGGFRGMLFGSVSQAVLHHAHCPVAVVRVAEVPSRGQQGAG